MKRLSPIEANTPIELSNNTFSMLFMDGDLRKVNVSGKEIIQRFYFAVRDKDWLNIPYLLKNFQKKETGSKTVYSYELLFCNDTVHFETLITITLDDGNLILEAKGKAYSTFLKNRIGFCIHLPASIKGTKCKVFHPDGTSFLFVFPELISPYQPFKNISSIEWAFSDGNTVLSFEGDIFEMEDQRNWTDASFKIYSTPLENPFPVEVEKGQLFHQKITLSISVITESKNRKIDVFDVSSDGKQENTGQTAKTLLWPSTGIACVNNLYAITSFREHSGKTPFSFLRIDFRFHNPEWEKKVIAGVSQAQSLNLKIYAILYFGNNFVAEAHHFVEWIKAFQGNLDFHSITLLSCETFVIRDESLQQLSRIMRDYFHHDVPIGSGTDANFAQINRNRPNPDYLDFISYSIQPQEHASDSLSVIENLQGQTDTVKTARSFSKEKDIHISALSIFRRFNANISFVASNDGLQKYPYMGTDFETGWFVGSLHQLISAGIGAVTCMCQFDKGSSLLTLFKYIAENPPEFFCCCGTSQPEQYSVLSWESGNKRHSVFANHTNSDLYVMHPFAEVTLNPYAIYYKDESLSD